MSPDGDDAGVVSRAAAFMIDAVLTVLIGLGIAAGAAVIHAVFSGGFSGTAKFLHPAAVIAVVPVLFGLYCVTGWTLAGRTLGKALFGLRVIDRRGGHPSLGRSILRLLGYLVSAIFWLGFAWIAVDRRHEGFHDKIARTRVVYD
ncbi:MAG TPA: RDD family protein [Actinocrinis sp.]|nr:RDD family protein [Actinocrinis sp.]